MFRTAHRLSRKFCCYISSVTSSAAIATATTTTAARRTHPTIIRFRPSNSAQFRSSDRGIRTSPPSPKRHRPSSDVWPTTTMTAKIVPSAEISTDFSPPSELKLMTEIDRSVFTKTVHVPGVVVPQVLLNDARKKLWKFVLRIPKIVPIQDHSAEEKIVLLDPKFIRSKTDFDLDFEKVVKNIVTFDENFRIVEVNLKYENWNADDILRTVLPEGENVSGYSITGHVVHFNLRPCHDPYKSLIGQVILDKLKNVRTVVNKTDTIDTVYRFFKMELLAGDDDMVVTVKENGCSFKFDFAKVYWNSRLGTEHERIVTRLGAGDLLYDVFAGVGPFAVPCSRKGVRVLANDLNPESFKWLNENVGLNSSKKYPCKDIQTFNMDGRDFIKKIIFEDLKTRTNFTGQIHIVMNLPALAVEFLDAFVGLYEESELEDSVPEPTIHCYTFSKAETDDHDFAADVCRRAEVVLGRELPVASVVRQVRNVAPNKEMMCLTFPLQRRVLVRAGGPNVKRIKLDQR